MTSIKENELLIYMTWINLTDILLKKKNNRIYTFDSIYVKFLNSKSNATLQRKLEQWIFRECWG